MVSPRVLFPLVNIAALWIFLSANGKRNLRLHRRRGKETTGQTQIRKLARSHDARARACPGRGLNMSRVQLA